MNVVTEIKYLGLFFNERNDFNSQIVKKFVAVERCFYSLNEFGIKPNGINPYAKAFLYKNYCLSKLTYAIGLTSLAKKIVCNLNTRQNNLIRYTLGLKYKSHINIVNNALEICGMSELYRRNQCLIAKLIHRHEISKQILIDSTNGLINYTNSFAATLNELAVQENKDIKFFVYYPDKFILESKERCSKKLENADVRRISNILAKYNHTNRNALIMLTARGETNPENI